MQVIDKNNVVNIIRNALNLIDSRLIDHGERVAYIIYKILSVENKCTKSEIADIVILAIFHDIGAYKTEEIDNMLEFETKSVWQHSIYGYLFIKNLSPLGELADSILYHHFSFDKLCLVDSKNKSIASLIHLADRLDVALNKKNFDFVKTFVPLKDKKFEGKYIDLFIMADKKYNIIDKIHNKTYSDEISELISDIELSYSQIKQYLEMLVYSIDFRSNVTVTHTITTVSISIEIAKALKMPDVSLKKIYYGSLLHDIGKIAIPLNILEKQGSLNDLEMEVMKSHINLTESILKNYVNDDILKIASRHHEKIDGSGYPYGLKGDVLSINERIVAVADIISALSGERSYKKEFDKYQIIKILQDMSKENKICPNIVNVVVNNYDLIVGNSNKNCKDILDKYNNIKYEYNCLYQKLKKLKV